GDEDRGHRQPIWYYFIQLPIMSAPWIIALGIAGPWIWSRRAERAERFLLSWFAPGFLFLCVAGTKRAVYLVPLLPALAILVGGWFCAGPRRRWLEPIVAGLTLSLGIAWFIVAPRVNEKRSFKPFCREMAANLRPETRLYG